MSDTTKIVLGIGAIGVVGYLLLSQSSSLRASPTSSTASTFSTATVAATGLVTAVSQLFSQSAQSSPPVIVTPVTGIGVPAAGSLADTVQVAPGDED